MSSAADVIGALKVKLFFLSLSLCSVEMMKAYCVYMQMILYIISFSRYVLVSKPKDAYQPPVPSPLEEQLLIERFPKMGARVLQTVPDPMPKVKKSYNMEYSPFVYQRIV